MDKDSLLSIIGDDSLGLLDVKPKASAVASADELLLTSFNDITQFVQSNGHEPEANMNNIQEFKLHKRLQALRSDPEKCAALYAVDELGLLSTVKAIDSIDDIFADDALGILDTEADSIFSIKNVPKETTMPDYVAKRKACKDFTKYEHLFKQCHADLANETRKLRPFSREQQIDEGLFFVLKGILLYVDKVGEREKVKGKVNARLRVIFDNGTESDMLLRSLSAELYKDGRRVTMHDDDLLEEFESVTEEDEETGFIYILRSLSDNEEIQSIPNLYKIGFSKVAVEDRIKNAEKEATYLYAPVERVDAYTCHNMPSRQIEQLLHTFFARVCLNVDVTDKAGRRYTPREWFIVPLSVIEQAITLLQNREIIHYRYDHESESIVSK